MTTTPATQALLPVTLEPCPFCGSDELSHGFADSGNHYVGLVKCEADGCGCFYYADDEEQAIACWNIRQAHSLPDDVGTGDYVATNPGQRGDGDDPYWMVEIQVSGGYRSVAEIYSGTAEDARAKARLAMAAWSGGGSEPARDLVTMLTAGGVQEGCRVFDHTPEEIGLHVMENHADILAALTPSALSGDAGEGE